MSLRVHAWGFDPLRRFERRPVYLSEDIEAAIEEFLHGLYKNMSTLSISDDQLEILVEAIVTEYDSAADLSFISEDVEGMTRFEFDALPSVLIDRRLAVPEMRRRRRMTIAHEIGHVMLHSQLFTREARSEMQLFSDLEGPGPIYCFRHGIELATNWMEWQASFAGGAILMPAVHVHAMVNQIRGGDLEPVHAETPSAKQLIEEVSDRFDVSKKAAEVRLFQLRHIEPDHRVLTLPFR